MKLFTVIFLGLASFCFGQTKISGAAMSGVQVDVQGPLVPRNGLYAWYQGDSVVLDTSASTNTVSIWQDISGNGRNASQSTKANQPAVVSDANGHQALFFDGVNSYLKVNSLAALGNGSNQAFSAFFVEKPSTNTGTGNIFSMAYSLGTNGIGGAPDIRIRGIQAAWNSQFSSIDDSLTVTNSLNTTGKTTNTVYASLGVVQGSGTAIWLTSTNVATKSGSLGKLTLDLAAFGATIRTNSSGTGFFPGGVAEAVFWNRALTGTEATNVLSYFSSKYGIK